MRTSQQRRGHGFCPKKNVKRSLFFAPQFGTQEEVYIDKVGEVFQVAVVKGERLENGKGQAMLPY